MTKPVNRRRRDTRKTRPAARPGHPVATVRPPDPSPYDTGSVQDRLARLLDTPHLARVVPHLAPETLHQLIQYRGLEACGELIASATPAQLTSVFDLDLWRSNQPGRVEQFDEERFGEWLELLVEIGDAIAARTVAAIDDSLVITGLSRYVRVFDPATLASFASGDDEPIDADGAPFTGLECEVGGYVVRARRTDGWDAIVALLVALDAGHPACFDSVMQGCRRLSNSTPEIDGLDDLLMEPEQLLHDVALDREGRRSEQGYSTPADARAFLQMARQPRHQRPGGPPSGNPLAAAYFRAADEAAAAADLRAPRQQPAVEPPAGAEVAGSIDAALADLLVEAGLVPSRPRALIGGTAPESSRLPRMQPLMEHAAETDEIAYLARGRELAFLTNTLMAGCSVQSRPFRIQEAHDAAAAICNLGLEHWPARWPEAVAPDPRSKGGPGPAMPDTFLVEHDLVAAFEVGWAVLHHDVSMFVARQLIATLTELRSVDAEVQDGLRALRRELVTQCEAGTPWRGREALEVIAMLDMPVWAALLGLLDECPVLPAALTAIVEGHTRAVSATAFEFISTIGQIGAVRAFVRKLPEALVAG